MLVRENYYKDYEPPKRFSIPVDQVPLSDSVTSSLPARTVSLNYVLYPRRVADQEPLRDASKRGFWELQLPSSNSSRSRNKISYDAYLTKLDELRVPRPPEEELWRPLVRLWVAERNLAEIEVYNAAEPQGRVHTFVAKDRPQGSFFPVPTANRFTEILEEQGFPPRAFDSFREDPRALEGQTDLRARMYRSSLMKRAVAAIYGPLSQLGEVALTTGKPQGQFRNSIRTELRT